MYYYKSINLYILTNQPFIGDHHQEGRTAAYSSTEKPRSWLDPVQLIPPGDRLKNKLCWSLRTVYPYRWDIYLCVTIIFIT